MTSPASAPGPSPGTVIRLLLLAGLRRYARRSSIYLAKGFRHRPQEGLRGPTARKSPMRPWLVVLFSLLFFGAAVMVSLQTLAGLTNHVERAHRSRGGQIGIQTWRYQYLAGLEVDLRRANHEFMAATQEAATAAVPQSAPAGHIGSAQSARQMAVARIRSELESLAVQLRKAGQAQHTADSLWEQFQRQGLDMFYPLDMAGLLPDPRAWIQDAPRMLRSVSLVLAILLLGGLFVGFGIQNQDLGKVEWSKEWLFTLPVGNGVLMLAQLLQYALLNVFCWVAVLPFSLAAYFSAGLRWWAIPLGLLSTAYFCLLLGAARLAGETWLRQRLPVNRLKNLQALFSLLGTICLMAMYLSPKLAQYTGQFSLVPPWVQELALYLPSSLPALLCGGGIKAIMAAAGMVGIALVASAWAVGLSGRLVSGGLIRQGGAYQGRRKAGGGLSGEALPWIGRGILGKELRLLLRDRSFFVQTIVFPALFVGMQFIVNPHLLESATRDFRHAAALAFGVGAYVLAFGGTRTLAAEGNALWLLCCMPAELDVLIRRKVLLWAAVAQVYTLATLGLAIPGSLRLGWEVWLNSGLAVSGVFIFAFVAAGLGALGTDVLEQEVHRKIRPSVMYMYMLLAGIYTYGFYPPHEWDVVPLLALSALMAYAIWDRVRDRIPYLLDPTASPPPQITLADGLVAAFAFFVLQALAFMILNFSMDVSAGVSMPLAYMAAGVAVVAMTLLIYRRRGLPQYLASLGLSRGRAGGAWWQWVLTGTVCAIPPIVAAQLYLGLVKHNRTLQHLQQVFPSEIRNVHGLAWLLVLASLAAPVVEEFIFRGLVLQGLRRKLPTALAVVVSSAVFALIHPPVSIPPVFVLALAAAAAFLWTRSLLAPIVTHMLYNAAAILLALKT